MAVPTSGNFEIFGTGSITTIAGAMHNTGDNVSGVDNFNDLKAVANAGKFNFDYAGEIQSPDLDVSASLQFRGYPVDPGFCRFVWIDDIVDSSRYGLRYKLPSNQIKDITFNTMFGTPYTYGSNSGVVYSVCSLITPSSWDSQTNTLVDLGVQRVDFADGGNCYITTDCVFVAPPTPTPTITITPSPTFTPTETPTISPTPTTTIVYNYYTVRGCPGSFYEGQDMRIRTLSSLNVTGNPSTADAISHNGSTFYAYATIDAITWQTNADLASITYSGAITQCPIIPTPTPTITITPTFTPTETPTISPTPTTTVNYNYYTMRGCPGSFYEGQDIRIRTTSFFNITGNPSTADAISYNGSTFYGYATIDAITWQTNADLASITYSGPITQCPVITTPTPTSTFTPTPITPTPTITAPAPTPTPATPTPTPTALGCFTYSIQNNDQSQNLTFQYRDCNGNLIQDQVVLADSGTPDFCAEEGSVSRQSGTFSWVLTTEATTCIEPTPTPTPTPTPVTPTPTPTSNCPSETLGDGPTFNDACADFAAGTGTVRYLDGPFPFASVIYRGADCTGNAAAGYYSDGGVWRYWNGTSFTSNGICPAY